MTLQANGLTELLELYRHVLHQILNDAKTLSDEDGALPTGCDGWSVKDQVSHVVGLEQSLSGSPEPVLTLPEYDHVSGDIAAHMETHVEARRALPMAAIVDELTALVPRRLEQLTSQVAEGDIEVPSALGGKTKLSASLPIRIMDLYAHELDICRALGRPVRISGPVADLCMEQCFGVWSAMLPRAMKRSGTLTLGTTAPHAHTQTLQLGASEPDGTTPSASIIGSRDTMFKLAFGREKLNAVLSEAKISGDPALLEEAKSLLAFTP